MNVQAGDLHNLIAFDARGSGGEGNEGSGDFSEQFQLWANVRPRLGGETMVAARLEGRTLVNITVRQEDEALLIGAAWRARDVDTGLVYQLKSIVDPFAHEARRGEWLELFAETGGHIEATDDFVSDWILNAGVWNDLGFWRDAQNWID